MSQVSAFQPLGLVQNPATMSLPDGSTPVFNNGRQSESLIADIHGRNYCAAYRGNLFNAVLATIATIPVVAGTVASKFSLYNPVGSGIIAELIDFDWAAVNATTVVNAWGLYYSAGLNAVPTSLTPGTPIPGRIGDTNAGKVIFYTAATHSDTPVRVAILMNMGAVTDVGFTSQHYEFNGKILMPPGSMVSVCTSTGAAANSAVAMSWAEWPV